MGRSSNGRVLRSDGAAQQDRGAEEASLHLDGLGGRHCLQGHLHLPSTLAALANDVALRSSAGGAAAVVAAEERLRRLGASGALRWPPQCLSLEMNFNPNSEPSGRSRLSSIGRGLDGRALRVWQRLTRAAEEGRCLLSLSPPVRWARSIPSSLASLSGGTRQRIAIATRADQPEVDSQMKRLQHHLPPLPLPAVAEGARDRGSRILESGASFLRDEVWLKAEGLALSIGSNSGRVAALLSGRDRSGKSRRISLSPKRVMGGQGEGDKDTASSFFLDFPDLVLNLGVPAFPLRDAPHKLAAFTAAAGISAGTQLRRLQHWGQQQAEPAAHSLSISARNLATSAGSLAKSAGLLRRSVQGHLLQQVLKLHQAAAEALESLQTESRASYMALHTTYLAILSQVRTQAQLRTEAVRRLGIEWQTGVSSVPERAKLRLRLLSALVRERGAALDRAAGATAQSLAQLTSLSSMLMSHLTPLPLAGRWQGGVVRSKDEPHSLGAIRGFAETYRTAYGSAAEHLQQVQLALESVKQRAEKQLEAVDPGSHFRRDAEDVSACQQWHARQVMTALESLTAQMQKHGGASLPGSFHECSEQLHRTLECIRRELVQSAGSWEVLVVPNGVLAAAAAKGKEIRQDLQRKTSAAAAGMHELVDQVILSAAAFQEASQPQRELLDVMIRMGMEEVCGAAEHVKESSLKFLLVAAADAEGSRRQLLAALREGIEDIEEARVRVTMASAERVREEWSKLQSGVGGVRTEVDKLAAHLEASRSKGMETLLVPLFQQLQKAIGGATELAMGDSDHGSRGIGLLRESEIARLAGEAAELARQVSVNQLSERQSVGSGSKTESGGFKENQGDDEAVASDRIRGVNRESTEAARDATATGMYLKAAADRRFDKLSRPPRSKGDALREEFDVWMSRAAEVASDVADTLVPKAASSRQVKQLQHHVSSLLGGFEFVSITSLVRDGAVRALLRPPLGEGAHFSAAATAPGVGSGFAAIRSSVQSQAEATAKHAASTAAALAATTAEYSHGVESAVTMLMRSVRAEAQKQTEGTQRAVQDQMEGLKSRVDEEVRRAGRVLEEMWEEQVREAERRQRARDFRKKLHRDAAKVAKPAWAVTGSGSSSSESNGSIGRSNRLQRGTSHNSSSRSSSSSSRRAAKGREEEDLKKEVPTPRGAPGEDPWAAISVRDPRGWSGSGGRSGGGGGRSKIGTAGWEGKEDRAGVRGVGMHSGIVGAILKQALYVFLRSKLDACGDLKIRVDATAQDLLFGQLGSVSITARRARFKGIAFSDVDLSVSSLRFRSHWGSPFSVTLDSFPVRACLTMSASDLNSSLKSPLILPILRSIFPTASTGHPPTMPAIQVALGEGFLEFIAANEERTLATSPPTHLPTAKGFPAGHRSPLDPWLPTEGLQRAAEKAPGRMAASRLASDGDGSVPSSLFDVPSSSSPSSSPVELLQRRLPRLTLPRRALAPAVPPPPDTSSALAASSSHRHHPSEATYGSGDDALSMSRLSSKKQQNSDPSPTPSIFPLFVKIAVIGDGRRLSICQLDQSSSTSHKSGKHKHKQKSRGGFESPRRIAEALMTSMADIGGTLSPRWRSRTSGLLSSSSSSDEVITADDSPRFFASVAREGSLFQSASLPLLRLKQWQQQQRQFDRHRTQGQADTEFQPPRPDDRQHAGDAGATASSMEKASGAAKSNSQKAPAAADGGGGKTMKDREIDLGPGTLLTHLEVSPQGLYLSGNFTLHT